MRSHGTGRACYKLRLPTKCEDCRAAARAHAAAHREERAAYFAAYRAAHREERAAYFAAYRAAHREEHAAYMRTYYAAHRKERAAYRATFESWESDRRRRLKGAREAILAKLEALKKEEVECLRILGAKD